MSHDLDELERLRSDYARKRGFYGTKAEAIKEAS
jgi:hypothetical protein